MRNAILLTLAGIFIISLIVIGISYFMLPTPAVPNAPPTSVESGIQDKTTWPYLLRNYEGKLAIFTEDLVTPDMIFDVYVRTLPSYDQEELTRGVRAQTYEELTRLVEDYIS